MQGISLSVTPRRITLVQFHCMYWSSALLCVQILFSPCAGQSQSPRARSCKFVFIILCKLFCDYAVGRSGQLWSVTTFYYNVRQFMLLLCLIFSIRSACKWNCLHNCMLERFAMFHIQETNLWPIKLKG